jgi:hypothetical protein
MLQNKAKQIADRMQIENSAASDDWIYRFKGHLGLVHKRLPGEIAAIDTGMKNMWLERLPIFLEGYES